jgi:hypothetical protein
MSYSQKPQEALNLLVTEECHKLLRNFLNVLVQTANEMEL